MSAIFDGDPFEAAPCGLVIAETNGTIVRVNATFCSWTGFASSDLVGNRRVQDLLPVGGRIFHQTHWGPLLQIQRSVAEVQIDVVNAAGKKLPMLLNVKRFGHPDAEFDHYAFLVVADRRIYEQELVRARKTAEEAKLGLETLNFALTEVARQKTEFMAVLSHELRNPLASIQIAAEVLGASAATEQTRRMQVLMRRQVDVLTRLIDDLWDLARVTQGQLEVRRERVDLSLTVAEVADGLRPSIEEKAIAFEVMAAAGPIWIMGDDVRLRQIVSNLVSNARKFTDAGGRITLSLQPEGNQAIIRVRDTGIGIAADKISRVFEMFAQVKSVVSRSQGLGIGLALVESLTKAHEGRVFVHSDGAGKGSEFIVALPLAER